MTALHPETNNSERICLQCYTFYLEKNISESREKESQERFQVELEKAKKESLEFHDMESRKIREEAKNVEKNLKDQISRLSREVEEKDTRIMSMNLTVEAPKVTKEDNSELIEKIKTLEIENQELKTRKPVYVAEPRSGCMKSCTIL